MARFDFDKLSGLPHSKQVEMLSDRIIELEEQLGLIYENEDNIRFKCHFSPKELQLVLMLMKHKGRLLSKEVMWFAIYGARPECDQADPKIVDVFLCRVRRKLAKYNIMIGTVWSRGYIIDEENWQKLQQLKEETAVWTPPNTIAELPAQTVTASVV
jgi:DNA-binding winged helix-turn-helix (wHTH) protein